MEQLHTTKTIDDADYNVCSTCGHASMLCELYCTMADKNSKDERS